MIVTKKLPFITILSCCLVPVVVVMGFTTNIVVSPFTSLSSSTSIIHKPFYRLDSINRPTTSNSQLSSFLKHHHHFKYRNLYYYAHQDTIDNDVGRTTRPSSSSSKNAIQGVYNPFFKQQWKKMKLKLKQPTHKVVSFMAATLIMLAVICTPLSEAFAAPSGGRMGGSFGGGGSSRSSGGGGGGGGYSRTYSSPSRSYSRGFSQGYSTGYYSRPSVTIAPTIGSPYYYPGGGGVTGVTVYRNNIGDFIVFGMFALVAVNFLNSINDAWNGSSSSTTMSELGEGVTVAQLSVALNVPDKDSSSSILTYLNRLSQTARTDSRVGVSNLVSQVALELLRQKRSVFAASTKYNHYRDGDKAQRDFSTRTIQERSKFDRETISKYGGVDYVQQDIMKRPSLRGGGDLYSPKATAAVITLLVAIDGDSTKLPVINTQADLEQALMKIATDVKVGDCLRSAEVLWTPEDSDDILSEREVIVDYPELRSI